MQTDLFADLPVEPFVPVLRAWESDSGWMRSAAWNPGTVPAQFGLALDWWTQVAD